MKHPVDVHVGAKIRHRRWMVGLTQQQLGEKVGTKFQQIQKYETGMNRVSSSRLWEISRALDVPISYFFDGVEGSVEDKNAAVMGGEAEKEAKELVRVYYQIPEGQRKKLIDLARVLRVPE